MTSNAEKNRGPEHQKGVPSGVQVFVTGGPLSQAEVVEAIHRVFPKFPTRKLKDAKERFATAIAAMGRIRFEHEINRQRGLAFDAEEIGCTWRRE